LLGALWRQRIDPVSVLGNPFNPFAEVAGRVYRAVSGDAHFLDLRTYVLICWLPPHAPGLAWISVICREMGETGGAHYFANTA